jgi:tRNA (adenine57-N1/adenine58-N1)-methyltransferase
MPNEPLRDGDYVMLLDQRGRRLLKRLHAQHRLTVRGTVLRCDDMIGRPEGIRVGAGEPESFVVLRPSHAEFVTEIERPAEPIFAKDVGAILAYGDLRAGNRVVEIGVGAGAMTIALLRAVGPAGEVASYEVRPDFAAVARKNVEAFCREIPNWQLHVADAAAGVAERNVDHVLVDVPDASPMLDPAAQALRPGGSLIVYLPTILQVKEVRDALRDDERFVAAHTLEVLERPWHIDGRSVRPSHRMVAHTAFLTFARRVASTG